MSCGSPRRLRLLAKTGRVNKCLKRLHFKIATWYTVNNRGKRAFYAVYCTIKTQKMLYIVQTNFQLRSVRVTVYGLQKTNIISLVIPGLTRNPRKNAHYPWDCGSDAAMTGTGVNSNVRVTVSGKASNSNAPVAAVHITVPSSRGGGANAAIHNSYSG